jgi:pimeloyl-ACP methyl ester carboxylesterase
LFVGAIGTVKPFGSITCADACGKHPSVLQQAAAQAQNSPNPRGVMRVTGMRPKRAKRGRDRVKGALVFAAVSSQDSARHCDQEPVMTFAITEHVVKTSRHTTFYLACGASDATPIIFMHGWPELSISWRHQLPVFGALGFRAIAPDMRGYGRSNTYTRHSDFSQEELAHDMIELLDALGAKKAIWVGHDLGAPVCWSVAQHHPDRCYGVANLCVPYLPNGFAPANLIALADRTLYPEAEFPAAQWDYQLFYEESFATATATFDSHVRGTVRALFRAGFAEGQGKPARTATARKRGGMLGSVVPNVPRDASVLSEQDEDAYVAALEKHGFFGPDSWYMNGSANAAYAKRAKPDLQMPVLMLHATYDYVCATVGTKLADPMRAHCPDLTEVTVASGHWMAQEKPSHVNAALAKWLSVKLPQLWLVKS